MAFTSSFGGGIVGSTTAAADTVFYAVVPPHSTYVPFTCLVKLNATNGNTVNNFTLLRPIGRTTASAAATTASNTVTLTADPGPSGNGIAANDQLVTANADGTFTRYKVGSWNATTKVATLVGSNLSTNIASGAKVWDFGIPGDTDPITGSAHPVMPGVAANTTGDVAVFTVSGFRSAQAGEPLLVYNPNATAQTVLNYAEYTYDLGY